MNPNTQQASIDLRMLTNAANLSGILEHSWSCDQWHERVDLRCSDAVDLLAQMMVGRLAASYTSGRTNDHVAADLLM